MKQAGKTIECFNDFRKYLFEHKVPALTFVRDGKTEILYTQMYIDEKDKEIDRLTAESTEWESKYYDLQNIINDLEKGIFKIRQSTFTKYNSNEWNNCLSYEDDIAPLLKIIHKSRELKESE